MSFRRWADRGGEAFAGCVGQGLHDDDSYCYRARHAIRARLAGKVVMAAGG